MAIETVAYFTVGGVWTGIYSNAVRQFPLMRRPQLLAACTAVGAFLGYQIHTYEEWAAANTADLVKLQAKKTAEKMSPVSELFGRALHDSTLHLHDEPEIDRGGRTALHSPRGNAASLRLSLTPIIVECGITWNSPCLRATCTSNVPLIDVCTGDPINPKIFKSACYAYCNNQVRWRRCDGDIADDDDADATAPTIETRCLGKSLEGSDAGQECRCRSNCHTCSYTVGGAAGIPGSCELCKNGKYLLNNECVDRDACTATPTPTSSLTHAYTPKGTGNFGKRCELVATSAPP
eukprot:gene21017-16833_t